MLAPSPLSSPTQHLLALTAPAPLPTAAPTNIFVPKRRERRDPALAREWAALAPRRDDGLPYAVGYPDCNYVGNDILSCFPEGNTTLVEDVWSKFVWNAQLPTFIGAGYLDVYLYHADSETVAKKYAGVPNAQGMIAIEPNEEWWRVESRAEWEGVQNLTWPYFFIVVTANATLNGAEVHQSTFAAVQTSMPSSLLTSSTALTTSANTTRTGSTGGSSTLQPGSSSNHSTSIPAWAIALLVVFGLAFLLLLLLSAYFLMRYTRRRGMEAAAKAHRTSEGSGEPMLEAVAAPVSVPAPVASARGRDGMEQVPLQEAPAGISAGDAERMAQAFRNALRGDGESP